MSHQKPVTTSVPSTSIHYTSVLDQDIATPADAGHVLTPSLANSLQVSDVLSLLETDAQSKPTQSGYTDCCTIWVSGKDQTVFKLAGDLIPIAEPAFIEQKICVRDTASGRFRAQAIVKYGISLDQANQTVSRMITTAVAAAQRNGHQGLLSKEKRKFPTSGWANAKRRKGN